MIMKIEETERRVIRQADGTERVENIWAAIKDDDRNIGNVTVSPGNCQIAINLHGFSDMEAGLSMAAETLGAELVAAEKGGDV